MHRACKCHIPSHQANVMKPSQKSRERLKQEWNQQPPPDSNNSIILQVIQRRVILTENRAEFWTKPFFFPLYFYLENCERVYPQPLWCAGHLQGSQLLRCNLWQEKGRGMRPSHRSRRHQSFSISPWKNQLLLMLGNRWETLQMRSLRWQPSFTAMTRTPVTNISAWEEGEKRTCVA